MFDDLDQTRRITAPTKHARHARAQHGELQRHLCPGSSSPRLRPGRVGYGATMDTEQRKVGRVGSYLGIAIGAFLLIAAIIIILVFVA